MRARTRGSVDLRTEPRGDFHAANPCSGSGVRRSVVGAAVHGCTPPGDGDVEYPDSVGRDPTAAEVCGKRRAWPDKPRFLTAQQVIRRFREETGWALGRFRSIGIKGARTVLEVKRDVHLRDVYEEFRRLPDQHHRPEMPGSHRLAERGGQAGPWRTRLGALTAHVQSGVPCWSGAKRYPRSNLVVSWHRDSCKRLGNKRWKRLDAVLRRIAVD